jgi:hypothetical protein
MSIIIKLFKFITLTIENIIVNQKVSNNLLHDSNLFQQIISKFMEDFRMLCFKN